MRLWSLHPVYLDCKGLLALWREGLLAKKVLENRTIGYKNHPQLIRFRNVNNPDLAINAFLTAVFLEARNRGYSFDQSKIKFALSGGLIPLQKGQLEYEFKHLLSKLKTRDPERFENLSQESIGNISPNPVFKVVDGPIETWERCK
ncbi:MAG: hypothetical protein KA140_07270 [Caldisericia bacterium]|nr:hypothetical protein [Caldisericia bacterium]